jgi:hypothetical protein
MRAVMNSSEWSAARSPAFKMTCGSAVFGHPSRTALPRARVTKATGWASAMGRIE